MSNRRITDFPSINGADIQELDLLTLVSVFEVDDQHFPPLMKVGVKFGQLTKDQHSHLAELIHSISDMSAESSKYYL